MQRLRLYDCRNSRLPTVIGACKSDLPTIADYINSAQRRLLLAKEAGDEGWWGTWAEMLFSVTSSAPYLTVPRSVARLEVATLCDDVIGIQNQFYEYLDFGNGRLPKTYATCGPRLTQAYTRNNVPTFVDLPTGPQILRVYVQNPDDAGKRVLLEGTDNNDKTIYSRDTYNPVNGIYVTLEGTSVDCATQFNALTGIQKDVTEGPIEVWAVDPTTAEEVLLVTMEPSEETASYRRYYFDSLPTSCCSTSATVQSLAIKAIVKLELIPVRVDTDYCLIQNLEAITEECQSVRLSEMDSTEAKTLSRERHNAAIGLLNGELNHYIGTQKPAISFKPFGSANLSRVAVGKLI